MTEGYIYANLWLHINIMEKTEPLKKQEKNQIIL